MTTCHACGSDTVEGATCVVCGAEPADAPSTLDPADAPDASDTDAARGAAETAPVDQPTAWPGSSPDSTDDARVDRGPVAERDDGADRRVPVGAGAPMGTAGPTGAPSDAGARPGSTTPPGGHLPPPPTATGGPATASTAMAAVPPHPDAVAVSETARNWAMVTHLSALVSAGLGGLIFLGPLLVWLVKKDEDRYVAHHATEALNFNLSMTLYAVLGVLLVFTIVGIPITILMAIIGFPLWFIASIVAAVRAQRGEGFRYPLTIRLVRE